MTPKALKDNVILLYTSPPATIKRKDGLIVLSEEFRRDMIRGKSKMISADNPPPDIIRKGKVVSSGAIYIGENRLVFFNRHDGDLFKYGDKIYYRLPVDKILGYAD